MNPFSNDLSRVEPQQTGALVDVAQSREVAEVQAAVILAKKFPRDQIQAMDRILVACQRPTLAESALYSYARGGTDITGPSIRLAEAIAQAWGNVQFGIRELDQRSGESTVEAYAWDLETNTRQSKVFQVKHIRHTKKGSYKLEDPRDIYEMTANQGARRLRSCILGIVPGDVIEAAVGQCEATLNAKADTSPEAIKKMVEAFAGYNVTKQQIEVRIQRKLDSITAAQVIGLRKIYNSLKDGMSTAADWFEVEQQAHQEDQSLKDKLKARKAAKAEPKPEPTPEAPVIVENEGPTVTCPASGDQVFASFCDAECQQRAGCPAHEGE